MNIEDYKRNGITIVRNFFEKKISNEIHDNIIDYINKSANKYEIFCYPEKLMRFIDYRFYKKYNFNINGIKIALKINKLINTKITKDIKNKFELNKINRIDSYYTEKNHKEITKWHCDQSFGGATDPGIYFNGNKSDITIKNVNKFFIHLTDVEHDNGAFAYIPGSHIVGLKIRECINNNFIEYEPFMDVDDAVNILRNNEKIFINKNLLTKEIINEFINNYENILNKKDFKYSIKANSGDLIIFNDFGYHKGTSPKKDPRLILRLWF
jgi:hypothetical protein